MPGITGDWKEALSAEFNKDYYKKLYAFVLSEYKSREIYPPSEDIFNAMHYTPLKDVKVVILGQDPYHEPGQAHGLAFSVKKGVRIPPSLVNIYKEIEDEYGFTPPNHGELIFWAKQGVLLLNTVLTVRAHEANSHKGKGWEEFTDSIIRAVAAKPEPVCYLLWGSHAGSKKGLINNPNHLILSAPHPSPLSAYRGFFGCGHFQKCNEFLVSKGLDPIDWKL